MPAADYGSDVSCNPDLDPSFGVRLGASPAMLAEAMWRRLQTPRGTLLDQPSYGTDVRDFVNESIIRNPGTLNKIRTLVEQECLKDERVSGATATVTFDGTSVLSISLVLDAGDGPFKLLLAVTQVTVSLLQAG